MPTEQEQGENEKQDVPLIEGIGRTRNSYMYLSVSKLLAWSTKQTVLYCLRRAWSTKQTVLYCLRQSFLIFYCFTKIALVLEQVFSVQKSTRPTPLLSSSSFLCLFFPFRPEFELTK